MARMEHGGTATLIIPGIRAFDPAEPDGSIDVTTLPGKIAVVAHDVHPVDGDFHDATWLSTTKLGLIIGVGHTVDPGIGQWDVHAEVIGTLTGPRWKAGMLEVY